MDEGAISDHTEFTVLALQLYDVWQESKFGIAIPNVLEVKRMTMHASNSGDKGVFGVAGFRPGRRGPFLSGKGPKTIDAPSGLN